MNSRADRNSWKLKMGMFLLFALILVQKLAGFNTGSSSGHGKEFPVAEKDTEGVVQILEVHGENLEKKSAGKQDEQGESAELVQDNIATLGGSTLPDTVMSPGNRFGLYQPLCYPKLSDIIDVKYRSDDLRQLQFLKEQFYIVNTTTKMTEADFDVEYFLKADLSLKEKKEPQILIYHTHGSEGFVDSRSGETSDTIVGIGTHLAEILQEKYGYAVLHDTTVFDKKDGKDNRNYAYNEALPYIEKLLKEHPSIEVVIDLHRDAGEKRIVTIDGKQAAKIMLFNGLSTNSKGEKIAYLPNQNLLDNLAFSFRMKLFGDEMYPGLMNRIFLKDYRYNMHLMEKYLLIELGTEKNTVEEARNAMEPLADVLAQVLGGN